MSLHDPSLWIMPLNGSQPNAAQLEAFIIDRIQNGIVKPGESIPSHRTIARMNGVNRNTALRAYTRLIAIGLLTHFRGSKSVVANPLPHAFGGPLEFSMPKTLPVLKTVHDTRATAISRTHVQNGFISVGAPFLNKDYGHTRVLDRIARKINTDNKMRPVTQRLHQAAIVHLQSRKFNIGAEHLLLIRGRNECMRCVLKALCLPGDTVITTAPLDLMINTVITECELVRIEVDATSDSFLKNLEQAMIRTPCKALYIRPGCTYPNCLTLDEATCLKVIELAKKYNFMIIEEEDDHEFWWGKYPFKPMAQYAHGGHVIYCAAMSRASRYLQHLRTVVAASQFVRELTLVCNAGFSYRDIEEERVITCLLESGALPVRISKLRTSKRKDLLSLTDILQLQLSKFASFEIPSCGTAIWLSFMPKMDLLKVLTAVNADGQQIRYVVYNNGNNQPLHHLQLNFSRFDIRECRRISIKIRAVLKQNRI